MAGNTCIIKRGYIISPADLANSFNEDAVEVFGTVNPPAALR